MSAALHLAPLVLRASAVVVGIGVLLLLSQALRVLLAVPRPRSVEGRLSDLLGGR